MKSATLVVLILGVCLCIASARPPWRKREAELPPQPGALPAVHGKREALPPPHGVQKREALPEKRETPGLASMGVPPLPLGNKPPQGNRPPLGKREAELEKRAVEIGSCLYIIVVVYKTFLI